MEQGRKVTGWMRKLAKATRVAICSGNHDNAGRQILADRAPVYEWLLALAREPQIITDGATEIVISERGSNQEQWLDSTGPFKDVMISIFATLAKQERARISERTIAGLKVARAKGNMIGRPPLSEETVQKVLLLNRRQESERGE